MVDSLEPEVVLPRLRGRFGREYLHVHRCTSTQKLLAKDAPEGSLAVAEEQTEGRGRQGNRWLAAHGTSLLFSLVLRPRVSSAHLPELTILGAQACVLAIHDVTGLRASMKDPNDVLVGGRKVAGVLGESTESRVVLGIGINVNVTQDALPTGVSTPATSLLIELDAPADRAELLVALLERLEHRYDAWLKHRLGNTD